MLEHLHAVALDAQRARSPDEAFTRVLARICTQRGWAAGHVFLTTSDGSGRLVSADIWYANPASGVSAAALAKLRALTQRLANGAAKGLVKKAINTAAPAFSERFETCGDSRGRAAAAAELRSSLVLPIIASGEVAAVLEFFATTPLSHDVELLAALPLLALQLGQVLERWNLERAVADAASEEQRNLGGQLHDSVAQVLTGTALLAETLRQQLRDENSPHTPLATRLVQYLSEAQQRVRQVSRGLMPVEPDATGLMRSLEHLSRECHDLLAVRCEFVCAGSVLVANNNTATELYYIAREAVHHAARHARATAVTIRLEHAADSLRLEVASTGPKRSQLAPAGRGQSLMRHRANVIGGTLAVVAHARGGATVTCTLPLPENRATARAAREE